MLYYVTTISNTHFGILNFSQLVVINKPTAYSASAYLILLMLVGS